MNEEIKKIRSVYFIGIGGIGMSALARYFLSEGVMVSGYDKTETELTKELGKNGANIHYREEVEIIPKDVELVVFTPAVPTDHKELVFYQQNGYRVVKRSDVLQLITQSSFNICIAGTHGKTTITTMTAHLLRDSGFGCNAFLGGISVNYETNFWGSEKNVCVVEADEYDRSFLKLYPDVAVITAMDADHLDIYGTAEAMENAFVEFSSKVKKKGLLLTKLGLKRDQDLKAENHWRYSLQDEKANAFATDIRIKNGSYRFDARINEVIIKDLELNIGGLHNVENAIAAIAVANYLGIGESLIKKAISSFKGVKRRFEYVIPPSPGEKIVFIDDYAHHPEELRALIQGAKSLFGGYKCSIIFQPHLYTRTRDLAADFAAVLDEADEVILLPVYPAREIPIPGVSSEMILDKMKSRNKRVLSKEELMKWIGRLEEQEGIKGNEKEKRVLVTSGAGDIDRLVEPIKKLLKN